MRDQLVAALNYYADQQFDVIYELLTDWDNHIGDYVREQYAMMASVTGLHPDDDFEKIIDYVIEHHQS